jgi:hypothetical protein
VQTRQFTLVVSLLLPAGIAAATQSAHSLNRLASALSGAAGPLRADFAHLALTELVADYAVETERARHELRQGPADQDLARWTRATAARGKELAGLAASVTADTPVQIDILHSGAVFLVISGEPVILSTLQSRLQVAYEQRVITGFCASNRCDELLDEPVADYPPLAGTPANTARPVWSFSEQAGPSCQTPNGLEFQFQDASNLPHKREACSRIVADLETLARHLRQHTAQGGSIDWPYLALHETFAGNQQHLVINESGDTLLLPLPALASVPDLLRLLLPWLSARANGENYPQVVLNAERVLAPLIASQPAP